MFCLRSWIPVLFFLSNPSPVYLVLFLSATYFLNRPCVYCSLLLFILVVSLFDFHAPWFEAPLSSETLDGSLSNSTAAAGTSSGSLVDGVAVFAQAATSTAQTLVQAAAGGVKNKAMESLNANTQNGTGYEWVKGLVGKKEWRIQCLDVLVRI